MEIFSIRYFILRLQATDTSKSFRYPIDLNESFSTPHSLICAFIKREKRVKNKSPLVLLQNTQDRYGNSPHIISPYL